MSIVEGFFEWLRGLFGNGDAGPADGEKQATDSDPPRLDPDNVTTRRAEADADAARKLASLDREDTEESEE